MFSTITQRFTANTLSNGVFGALQFEWVS